MTNAQSCSYQSLKAVADPKRIDVPIPMHSGADAAVLVAVCNTIGDDPPMRFIIEPQGCIARTYWTP